MMSSKSIFMAKMPQVTNIVPVDFVQLRSEKESSTENMPRSLQGSGNLTFAFSHLERCARCGFLVIDQEIWRP